MLSFYGNGAAAGDGGGSTVEQLWERGSGEGSVKQILTNTTVENVASGKEAVAQGTQTTASGQSSHAEGYLTVASSTASHAEGYGTTATQRYSHVEGMNTIATTYGTHAEGNQTTVSGVYAHAEGYATKAEGANSHSEGQATKATGRSSHAEGQTTTASGDYSHSEGYYTKASALHTHAQNYYTIAASTAQTALGKYNIEDNQNQYAVILGNGTASNARSNALTVDWNGNVNIAGNLTYNGGQTLSSSLPIIRMEEDPMDLGTYSFYDNNNNALTWANLFMNSFIIDAYIDGAARRVYISDYTCVSENGEYLLYYISLKTFIPGYIIFDRVKMTFGNQTATTATFSSDMIQVAFGAYV